MVQTRSAAQRMESVESDAKQGEFQEGNSTKPLARSGIRPVAKKPCTDVAASKKRRRGKPSELCQLNLDVLFLIAAYIHPLDLLNLARTCKSLRELLMDKCSAFVWKTAFQQVDGLPPCPTDLTEPEYANLVFFSRCHNCGKYTAAIFWNVRRRFCPSCRIRHLRLLSSCNEVIRKNRVLAVEYITVKKGISERVDRVQAALFMDEYRLSSDKKQFISDKAKQSKIILKHAEKCEAWQKKRDLERRRNIRELQQQRSQSILHRLQQHGYSREISYFGSSHIQKFRESDFRSTKPLTDKEWEKMWPKWTEIMSTLRSRWLESNIYRPRRDALASAYTQFVQNPSPDAPAFDLLPHVADVARFPPFADLINAPEGISVKRQSYTPVFAELPGLIGEWKKELDAELAELVKIPLRLSSRNASGSRAVALNNTRAESSAAHLNKLHLASALFRTDYGGVFRYHEVFSVSMLNCQYEDCPEDEFDRSGSISDRFGIHFLAEAPYIVHACGLDPNIATTDDVDHRNARLKCLFCEGPTLVMDWKHAMWHAYSCHQNSSPAGVSLFKPPRWQLVGDEHIDAIQSVEKSVGKILPCFLLCLLCRHHVGDAKRGISELSGHMWFGHSLSIARNDIKQGVHYAAVGMFGHQSRPIEMIEDGEHVTFKVLPK